MIDECKIIFYLLHITNANAIYFYNKKEEEDNVASSWIILCGINFDIEIHATMIFSIFINI